jgi:hypothetical protein
MALPGPSGAEPQPSPSACGELCGEGVGGVTDGAAINLPFLISCSISSPRSNAHPLEFSLPGQTRRNPGGILCKIALRGVLHVSQRHVRRDLSEQHLESDDRHPSLRAVHAERVSEVVDGLATRSGSGRASSWRSSSADFGGSISRISRLCLRSA